MYDSLTGTDYGPLVTNPDFATSTDSLHVGPSRNQPHSVIIPRAVPFSILMPFPISQPSSEGLAADRDVFPLPDHNAPGSSSQGGVGDVDILLSFGNPNPGNSSPIEDGEVNSNSGGPTIPLERTQQEAQIATSYREELGSSTFLGSSGSPYVSSDSSMIPASGDIATLISSSSYLSPVFPTST